MRKYQDIALHPEKKDEQITARSGNSLFPDSSYYSIVTQHSIVLYSLNSPLY